MTGLDADRVHDLKTHPPYFAAVWSGEKTFEVRYDDRGFQRDDVLVLKEYDPHATCSSPGCRGPHDFHGRPGCRRYSGRTVTARVGFVCASLPQPVASNRRPFNGSGYVVMSLVDTEREDAPE